MTEKKSRPMGEYGPWVIKETQTVYEDPYIEVQLDQVIRPDLQDGQHVVVYMKAGVCVVPIDAQNNVILTSEFHYGVGRQSLEGVSGGIESGEEPLETAKRELAEELGLAAQHWQSLTTVDPFTTIVVSPTQLFVAKGLSEVPKAPEGTEQIESVKMPMTEVIEKVKNGEISHAPTCVLLLMMAAYLD